MTIRLRVGPDGKAGFYSDSIPDVEVSIEGLINEKMSLAELLGTYVVPSLQFDAERIVARSRNRSWTKYVGIEDSGV